MRAPSFSFTCAMNRCDELPMPKWPQFSWPGRARSYCTSSWMLRMGRLALTTTAVSMRLISEIGAKSPTV